MNSPGITVSMNPTQPLVFQSQEPVLSFDEQTEIDQENALMELYSAEDENLSEEMNNSQGSMTQGDVNMDQGHSEVLEEVQEKTDLDPETRDLGKICGNTKYNLRVRPERNRRYYNLELGPNCENNLWGGPDSGPDVQPDSRPDSQP